MILEECERRRYARYPQFSRKPAVVRLPYFENLDAHRVNGVLHAALEKQKWPTYLIEWHKMHLRIVTESQPNRRSRTFYVM